jgi:hypothetical protein
MNGADACLYEMDERGEDRVRTILVNVSGTLYAVTAMAALSLSEETRLSVFLAHDDFASALRWTPKTIPPGPPAK